ncbi:methyltransferase type 11 [Fusarium albosuccineum]|uniref:Methyltransferase type 11 n=1 Tax=Fusarium albosuccineum TaxID=1237068 RepID=A0A8H4KZ50_9HYPO|nr:methyltransferase type 11 [Fusarium albosuccineum]
MGRVRPYIFDSAVDRDKHGPSPSPEDVLNLTNEARDCHDRKQNEAGWNMMVHYPLLFQAIYGSQKQDQLLGITPCTTAKIMQEYLPSATQAKMVDFCIYLDPKSDAIGVEKARSILPCGYINHTDFYTLRDRPIALSIETKAPTSTSVASAELQIGTWQSAQWRFLEDLVSRSGGSLDELLFLPAIIVQGHQWSFAATTREGQRTVLWLPFEFGSTENVIGVYKTVLGLQKLCRWAERVFWPWYKKNALGIIEDRRPA